jgi:rhamnose utilization protein RhaD (predicted bifunctional aldolase and dehydrogenase)
MIAEGVKNNPNAELVLMEKHGLVTWGDTSHEAYEKTIVIIREAEEFINSRQHEEEAFGGQAYNSLSEEERQNVLASVMPVIRGEVSDEKKMLLTYDDAEDVLQFVNSKNAATLSQVGAACPDDLVHTKMKPLYVEWDPQNGSTEDLIEKVKVGVEQFKEEYIQYFERNKNEGDVMFEAAPRVILILGDGCYR